VCVLLLSHNGGTNSLSHSHIHTHKHTNAHTHAYAHSVGPELVGIMAGLIRTCLTVLIVMLQPAGGVHSLLQCTEQMVRTSGVKAWLSHSHTRMPMGASARTIMREQAEGKRHQKRGESLVALAMGDSASASETGARKNVREARKILILEINTYIHMCIYTCTYMHDYTNIHTFIYMMM